MSNTLESPLQHAQKRLPFMHPCLLDHFNEVLLEQSTGSISSLRKLICFRTAELLRVKKALDSKLFAAQEDISVELFARVGEACYAGNQGRGQGLKLVDVFFPQTPPFILARSKIPYHLRDFHSLTKQEPSTGIIIRATILLQAIRSRRNSTKRFKEELNRNAMDTSGFEVLDIQASSWQEIDQARDCVEMKSGSRKGQAQRQALQPSAGNVKPLQPKTSINSSCGIDLDDSMLEELASSFDLSDIEN